jgi:glycosyl transferase family 25
MRIFIVNLDRNPLRWQRMAGLLAGLDFQRIAAVDGKTIDGPEFNDRSRPRSCETLSRYNRACILSHRRAYEEFLAGQDPYGCIMEDDVYISADFHRFVSDESWIPPAGDLIKLETTQQEIRVGTKTIPCLDRALVRLDSLNYGAAGYIVSRRGAQILLDLTVTPDRAIDLILFDEAGLKKLHPVHQLIPALCIQTSHWSDEIIFPEMASTIQQKKEPAMPVVTPAKKSSSKITRELTRPFRQLRQKIKTGKLRLRGLRLCRVPYV